MGGFALGAILGKYLNRWGPRCSVLIGSSCLGSGFGLAALGVHIHSLPVLWAGGLIWGFANGWSYVPPLSALLKWFPERKGFASSCVVCGFGGGAAIAAPMFSNLLQKFKSPPTYLGPVDTVELVNQGGKLFASGKEIVVATAAEAQAAGLIEGVYLVGTGNTGVTSTLLFSGLLYSSIMGVSALQYRTPEALPSEQVQNQKVADIVISAATSLRTPQFYLLFSGFGFALMPTYGLLTYAKTMMGDCFGQTLPDVATAAACGTFVSVLSLSNMGGRMVWPNIGDFVVNKYYRNNPVFGRRATFTMIFSIFPVAFLCIPWSIEYSVANPGLVLPLWIFVASNVAILSSFGGTAGSRPAILADTYGSMDLEQLLARQLSVVLISAWMGPAIMNYFRNREINTSIMSLSSEVDPFAFEAAFGATKELLPELIAAKTVTITKLMELVPDTIQDPTPFLYNNAMLAMASFQSLALITNLCLRPIDSKYYEKNV